MEDNFFMDRGGDGPGSNASDGVDGSSGNRRDGGDRLVGNASKGSGGNGSDGERWGVADEASLALPVFTSCCEAWLLTSRGPRVGDPCSKGHLPSRNVLG